MTATPPDAAVLVLSDGTVYRGTAFGARVDPMSGAPGRALGEVVFHTGMSGYQEILTDPSYVGQIVTMAYPEIGNVGTNAGDEESTRPHAVGMVVKEVSAEASNWRSQESLDAYLKRHGVAGISGLDTRKLVRHLRINGAQMGVISTEGTSLRVSRPGIPATPWRLR